MVLELEPFIFPPSDPEAPVNRIITPRRAATLIRGEICKVTKPKNKIGTPTKHLFRITASAEGELMNYDDMFPTPILARNKLQEVGLKAMKEFGLDVEKFVDMDRGTTVVDERGEIESFSERREYPSLTIRGIVFNRTVSYFRDHDHPTEVVWSVQNHSDESYSSWNTSASWEEILRSKLGESFMPQQTT